MKAILVIEMPDSCRECPLELQKYQCAVNSEIMKDNTIRQDWCPLKPMPEKKETPDNILGVFMNIGRSACIDEILGDKE